MLPSRRLRLSPLSWPPSWSKTSTACASRMAEDRRLFNEHSDDPWGFRSDRHRGDEATQAKTWADGCLGEAVIGRVLRSLGNRALKLSRPVEWVPSTDPGAEMLRCPLGPGAFLRQGPASKNATGPAQELHEVSWNMRSFTFDETLRLAGLARMRCRAYVLRLCRRTQSKRP
ncbi:hypothetical protein CBM2592_A190010 [Cupriavidus taiwanensis]|nr:hypothetical protein CBM2592_A190010 [Cupriavidus taiwanensis]SOY83033.1 hypothetical protein CBM2591_A230011 [Cupriavidus taiwanensis]SOZ56209.1 hypothetical protein CBM2617_A200018 [Cupriavidus taiwanensis]SOZ78803.1 hypothetical protein CBM2618_A180018 [Cupriavidus taiwanensis]SOZ79074.1 hypothetical protein CBM2622_A170017 [Cupriavidus taiwanensis]